MRSLTVPQALVRLGRPVFTTREVASIRAGSLSATSQVLRRMEREGLVTHVARGLWCVPADPRFTAYALVEPLAGSHRSYVSFLSALHLHGVIEQIPQVIYAATTGHTRVAETPLGTVSFHRLAPPFFDGFEWHGRGQRFLLATPEKALIDCLYLSGRKGRRFGTFPELDLGGRIDPARGRAWVARISDPRLRVHVARRLAELLGSARGVASGARPLR